jgi:aurora kinase
MQLLRYEVDERLPLQDVLKHPWVVKYRPKGVVRPSVALD